METCNIVKSKKKSYEKGLFLKLQKKREKKKSYVLSPFLLPYSRSIERAMSEKKDQIRRLDEEIKRDGERTNELDDKLKVSIDMVLGYDLAL